jgi:hypothetical protein
MFEYQQVAFYRALAISQGRLECSSNLAESPTLLTAERQYYQGGGLV